MAQLCGQNYCCNPSTQGVCGDFSTPTNPDEGRCHPYRVKLSCERPDTPAMNCPSRTVEIVQTPDNPSSPFYILTPLMDENCEEILDQDGNTIITKIS